MQIELTLYPPRPVLSIRGEGSRPLITGLLGGHLAGPALTAFTVSLLATQWLTGLTVPALRQFVMES